MDSLGGGRRPTFGGVWGAEPSPPNLNVFGEGTVASFLILGRIRNEWVGSRPIRPIGGVRPGNL